VIYPTYPPVGVSKFVVTLLPFALIELSYLTARSFCPSQYKIWIQPDMLTIFPNLSYLQPPKCALLNWNKIKLQTVALTPPPSPHPLPQTFINTPDALLNYKLVFFCSFFFFFFFFFFFLPDNLQVLTKENQLTLSLYISTSGLTSLHTVCFDCGLGELTLLLSLSIPPFFPPPSPKFDGNDFWPGCCCFFVPRWVSCPWD